MKTKLIIITLFILVATSVILIQYNYVDISFGDKSNTEPSVNRTQNEIVLNQTINLNINLEKYIVNSSDSSSISFSYDGDQYSINVVPHMSAKDVLEQALISPVNVMSSTIERVGDYEVVSYVNGGSCEFRIIDVIGRSNNLRFLNNGCVHSRQIDFSLFKEIVKTVSGL